MGIVITKRDAKLLNLTLNHGVLSFDQVRRYCFTNLASPTIHNRLGQLKKAGLLKSMKVGTVVYHGGPKNIGVVYQATSETHKFFRKHLPNEEFAPKLQRINTSTLHHDLLVVDVIYALTERFAQLQVVNGKVVQELHVDQKRVPDALIHHDQSSLSSSLSSSCLRSSIAVELELTAKSKGRYRQIIMQYRMAEKYSKVLYVVSGSTIKSILSELISHKPVPGLPPPSTGKFYFVDLKELLQRPKECSITNSSTEPLVQIETQTLNKKEELE